jgi:aminoglycoside phosphotransferase (APT) family kinase protein
MLAVISPPRVDRFRALVGLEPGDRVTADFGGWSKLVLLTRDLAVLFPRDHTQVTALRWELEALQTVAAARLPEVPEVVAVWEDIGISPYPVVAIRRLPGTILEQLLPSLEVDTLGHIASQLGHLAARWHAVDPGPLVDRPKRVLPHRVATDSLLGTAADALAPDEAAGWIRRTLALDAEAERVARAAIERARSLDLVVVHSDIHEAQILVDPDAEFSVTGVLDWQTARVDHPFTEFDLGQWGPTIWRAHRTSFPSLRRSYWNAYAQARGLAGDLGRIFEWVWAVSQAMDLAGDREREFGPDVTGSLEEALGTARNAMRELA